VLDGDVQSFEWTGDSDRIVYLADQDMDTINELFASLARITSSSLKISGTMVATGMVHSYDLVP